MCIDLDGVFRAIMDIVRRDFMINVEIFYDANKDVVVIRQHNLKHSKRYRDIELNGHPSRPNDFNSFTDIINMLLDEPYAKNMKPAQLLIKDV